MSEVIRVYQEDGWPAFRDGGFDAKLKGYFLGDVGALNQVVHLWRFDDDADRRDFWARVYADEAFMRFAARLRPLLRAQSNKLLLAAPFGPAL
jgi:hypothetical protein